MELSTARQLIADFVSASKEFSFIGPAGFEDILARSPEGQSALAKDIRIWDEGLGEFSLLLTVYSKEFDEQVVSSSKFNKIFTKSAKAYLKQNVKLSFDGPRFYLMMAIVAEHSDLLRVMSSFANLNLGVSLLEEHLAKKLRL